MHLCSHLGILVVMDWGHGTIINFNLCTHDALLCGGRVCGGVEVHIISMVSLNCHTHTHMHTHTRSLSLSLSANTTVTGSPNLISTDDAKAIVAEAAPPGPPKPIDPEGTIIITAPCK